MRVRIATRSFRFALKVRNLVCMVQARGNAIVLSHRVMIGQFRAFK